MANILCKRINISPYFGVKVGVLLGFASTQQSALRDNRADFRTEWVGESCAINTKTGDGLAVGSTRHVHFKLHVGERANNFSWQIFA